MQTLLETFVLPEKVKKTPESSKLKLLPIYDAIRLYKSKVVLRRGAGEHISLEFCDYCDVAVRPADQACECAFIIFVPNGFPYDGEDDDMLDQIETRHRICLCAGPLNRLYATELARALAAKIRAALSRFNLLRGKNEAQRDITVEEQLDKCNLLYEQGIVTKTECESMKQTLINKNSKNA